MKIPACFPPCTCFTAISYETTLVYMRWRYTVTFPRVKPKEERVLVFTRCTNGVLDARIFLLCIPTFFRAILMPAPLLSYFHERGVGPSFVVPVSTERRFAISVHRFLRLCKRSADRLRRHAGGTGSIVEEVSHIRHTCIHVSCNHGIDSVDLRQHTGPERISKVPSTFGGVVVRCSSFKCCCSAGSGVPRDHFCDRPDVVRVRSYVTLIWATQAPRTTVNFLSSVSSYSEVIVFKP